MPTMTTIPITVGIRLNMVAVAVVHPVVVSAAIICCVILIAIAPSSPAIRAFMIVLVMVL